MVFRRFVLQAITLSLLCPSMMAYTQVAPGLDLKTSDEEYKTDHYYDGTFLLAANSSTISTNLQFRGLTLSGNHLGVSNSTKLTLNRGPMQTFVNLDLYGYNSNFPSYPSQAGPSYNITDSGSTMIGSTVGMKLFLNYCRDTSFAITRSIYQWPNAQYLIFNGNPNGSTLAYNNTVGAGLAQPKSVQTSNLELDWRSYRLLISYAHTSNMLESPDNPLSETWQGTWGNYYSVATPNFQIGPVRLMAHYGYWKSTGIEIDGNLSVPVGKHYDVVLKGYNFKSFLWSPETNYGVTLSLVTNLAERFPLLDF